MTYHLHEGHLTIPAITQDRSLQVLSVQLAPTHIAQVVISRDTLEPGETLAQSVERQLRALERQVKRYVEHSRESLAVGPAHWPAIAIHSQFTQGNHTQWQAQVAVQNLAAGDRAVLVFTLSSPQALTPEHVAAWWGLVRGFVPRQA